MEGSAIIKGKREILARVLAGSGAISALSYLPPSDSLLVLNYHRVGNADDDPYDPGVFSATGEELDDQVSFLKRNRCLVTLDEALAFIEGTEKDKTRRCRVLITFDDGYLDNYEIAFPVLRSHGVQAVFYLCSGLVGTSAVPWWDNIAFILKTAKQKKFTIQYPGVLEVDIDKNGLTDSLLATLALYKLPENRVPERFLRELKESAQADDLPIESRRFLSWNEAEEMVQGGMAIGAHTHSHPRLSLLEEDEQRKELSLSRTILGEKLRIPIDTLAYPFGSVNAFTEQTQKIAQDAGFRAAFSYYGGANKPGLMSRYDLKRVSVRKQSWPRFKAQVTFGRLTGNFWP